MTTRGDLTAADATLSEAIELFGRYGSREYLELTTGRNSVHGVERAAGSVGQSLKRWAVVAAVYLALWPLVGSLDGLFDALAFVGSDGGRLAVVGPILAVLSVARAVVITPLAEELVFRGALYGWLRQWWPAWATIAATAAAIAGIHGFLVVMPYTLVAGIGTGWLRERTGSVAAGFVTHVLNNAMLVATTLLLTG